MSSRKGLDDYVIRFRKGLPIKVDTQIIRWRKRRDKHGIGKVSPKVELMLQPEAEPQIARLPNLFASEDDEI